MTETAPPRSSAVAIMAGEPGEEALVSEVPNGMGKDRNGIWRIDLFHRIFDIPDRAGGGAGGARSTHCGSPNIRTSPSRGASRDQAPAESWNPFVTLTAAAVVTKRLKLATGICLVIQRDTIQTAKLVASLDQISAGRFIFGIGGGWNAEEMENHGTVYATRFTRMREQIEAMKEIWTRDTPEYHGEVIDFRPMQTWPKPVQKPHPPIIVGGAFQYAARRAIRYGDGLVPQAADAGSGEPEEYMPRFRRMAEEAGRDPRSLPVTLGGAPEDPDRLKRYRDLGIARINVRLPPAKGDEILPVLDRWAKLIRQLPS